MALPLRDRTVLPDPSLASDRLYVGSGKSGFKTPGTASGPHEFRTGGTGRRWPAHRQGRRVTRALGIITPRPARSARLQVARQAPAVPCHRPPAVDVDRTRSATRSEAVCPTRRKDRRAGDAEGHIAIKGEQLRRPADHLARALAATGLGPALRIADDTDLRSAALRLSTRNEDAMPEADRAGPVPPAPRHGGMSASVDGTADGVRRDARPRGEYRRSAIDWPSRSPARNASRATRSRRLPARRPGNAPPSAPGRARSARRCKTPCRSDPAVRPPRTPAGPGAASGASAPRLGPHRQRHHKAHRHAQQKPDNTHRLKAARTSRRCRPRIVQRQPPHLRRGAREHPVALGPHRHQVAQRPLQRGAQGHRLRRAPRPWPIPATRSAARRPRSRKIGAPDDPKSTSQDSTSDPPCAASTWQTSCSDGLSARSCA